MLRLSILPLPACGCRFVLIAGLLVLPLLPPLGAAAQRVTYTPEAPYQDSLRALIVFVRFPDDTFPGGPLLDYQGWRLPDGRQAPSFASGLLAPDPTPPFPDSSLTAYFHQQSEGHFLLFGDVVDSVFVAHHPEARYHRPQGGLGDLTVEILDRLDAAGIDFQRYDYNRDGDLDHLFLIVRGAQLRDQKAYTWTGISCLHARCGGGVAGGGPGTAPRYGGVAIDWNRSGSILWNRAPGNIDPFTYHVRLMAHELGHDLWAPFFTHVPDVRGNGLPIESNRGPTCVGYTLMAGAGGGMDCGGDQLLSVFERQLLGWIACDTLTTTTYGLALPDLYTSGACMAVPLPDRRTLLLANRQRIGYFDQYRRGGRDAQYELGLLRTTGLLITLRDRTRYDVVPADGTLDLAIENAPYRGDLFGPATKRQLTPWTRPNSNGYARHPVRGATAWFGIDAIRMDPSRTHTMQFDFIGDMRERPIIRAESWMGPETAGTTFDAEIVITSEQTLHVLAPIRVAAGLRIAPEATLCIHPEGEVVIAPGAVLVPQPRARIVNDGLLRLMGRYRLPAGPPQPIEGEGRTVVRLRR